MKDSPSYIEKGFEAVERSVAREQDLSELLLETIGRMHPEYRRALELYWGLVDARERTYAEVAREMGFSPSTARRRVLAAKRELNVDSNSGKTLRDYITQ